MRRKTCAHTCRSKPCRSAICGAICLLVSLFQGTLQTVSAGPVAFTEIMYNPSGDDGFFRRGRNTEWLEVANVSDRAVSLLHWQLRKTARRRVRVLGTFTEEYTLLPGQLAVLVPGRSLVGPEDYRRAWSIDPGVLVIPVSGWGDTSVFGLSNSSGEIQLVDAAGNLADAVRYGRGSDLPVAANGTSLEISLAPGSDLALANDRGDAWRLAGKPIPHPGVYAGVRFGSRDRGSPGALAAGAVPAPATAGLVALGAAVAATGFRRRRGRISDSEKWNRERASEPGDCVAISSRPRLELHTSAANGMPERCVDLTPGVDRRLRRSTLYEARIQHERVFEVPPRTRPGANQSDRLRGGGTPC